jgi:hypothetical protein
MSKKRDPLAAWAASDSSPLRASESLAAAELLKLHGLPNKSGDNWDNAMRELSASGCLTAVHPASSLYPYKIPLADELLGQKVTDFQKFLLMRNDVALVVKDGRTKDLWAVVESTMLHPYIQLDQWSFVGLVRNLIADGGDIRSFTALRIKTCKHIKWHRQTY